MNHRETGSFTPSIKYHRAVPRIPAVLLKVYLKGLDSPKALRADIVFEPRERERETSRTRRILRDHSFTRLVSFVKRAPVKKATVNWVLGIHLVADNLCRCPSFPTIATKRLGISNDWPISLDGQNAPLIPNPVLDRSKSIDLGS